MKYYLVLGIAILTNAAANILIKIGMNRVGGMDIGSLHDILNKFMLNQFIWAGVFLFGAALVTYSYVLSYIQLSVAYPIMTSMGFVVVILISLLYLGEKLTLLQIGV